MIAPLSSLNITDEENSVNYFKLTDETETNDLNSLNNLKNQENSIEENIEEVRLMAKQEKNEVIINSEYFIRINFFFIEK